MHLQEIVLAKLLKMVFEVPFSKEEWRIAIEDIIERNPNGAFIQTPQSLNKLGVRILSPSQGTFYDGTAGVNGTIVEAHQYAKENSTELFFYTQELNVELAAIGAIRAFVNGIVDIDAEVGDVLINPKFSNGSQLETFDYIMMDIPFGQSWAYEEKDLIYDKFSRFTYGKPNKSSSEWLFVSHAIKSLNDRGKAVVLMTSGSLFNTGTEAIRSAILREDIIEAVIALPTGLFSNTNIPTNMLVLNKNKQSKNTILFINAEHMGQSMPRTKKVLSSDEIETVVRIYETYEEVPEVSRVVRHDNLEKSLLMPSKYVAKAEVVTSSFGKVDIKLEEIAEFTNCKKLGEVGKFFRGMSTSNATLSEMGEYQIINLADVQEGILQVDKIGFYDIQNRAKIEAYTVEEDDLIVSCKGNAIKICIVPKHEGKLLISQNFIGIRPNDSNSSLFVKAYLESPLGQYLIQSKQLGSTITMLNLKDLQEIDIVDMPFKEQQLLMNRYREQQEQLRKQILMLEAKMKQNQLTLYKDMGIDETFTIKEHNK